MQTIMLHVIQLFLVIPCRCIFNFGSSVDNVATGYFARFTSYFVMHRVSLCFSIVDYCKADVYQFNH